MDGLRSRLAAAFELLKPIESLTVLNGHEALMRELACAVFLPAVVLDAIELPPGNKICSVLIAGYPEFEFKRAVARSKPIRITRS